MFCIIDRVVDEAIKPVSISIETTELPLDNENPFLNNDVGNEILNVLGGGVWRRCFNVSKHSCPPGEKIEGN